MFVKSLYFQFGGNMLQIKDLHPEFDVDKKSMPRFYSIMNKHYRSEFDLFYNILDFEGDLFNLMFIFRLCFYILRE